jgi:hypothetical protein
MFSLALFIGIYSYFIFFLGLAGYLYKEVVIIFTILAITFFVFYKRDSIGYLGQEFLLFKKRLSLKPKKAKTVFLLAGLLLVQIFINFVGVLSPELGFDALWYHLTLPKLFLLNHAVYHIPGGLLYYSDMPKVAEMLFVGALSFGNEMVAKFSQFMIGIFIGITLYRFSRTFLSPKSALVAVAIYYANIVVAWESTAAYIDLIRTFFEFLALWSFINWVKTEKLKWFITSSLMVGFAITSKFLGFGSLFIFLLLIIFTSKKHILQRVQYSLVYCLIALCIPLPWFIFAYIHTGNPFYPFFSSLLNQLTPEPLSITRFTLDTWNIFVNAPDPVSPLYLMFLPLIILFFKMMKKELRLIVIYSLLAIIVWYFTPRIGGGRFLLPYLPAFSLVCGAVFEIVQNNKKKYGFLSMYLTALIIVISILTIGYRSAAEKKYIPLILGKETKDDFLRDNLNFTYGDFYDIDAYIKNHVMPSEMVLLYGFHNLYYVDFPFIDASWVKKGDRFSYIAVQNTKLPERFKNWQMIYSNDKTMVKLYKNKFSEVTVY